MSSSSSPASGIYESLSLLAKLFTTTPANTMNRKQMMKPTHWRPPQQHRRAIAVSIRFRFPTFVAGSVVFSESVMSPFVVVVVVVVGPLGGSEVSVSWVDSGRLSVAASTAPTISISVFMFLNATVWSSLLFLASIFNVRVKT